MMYENAIKIYNEIIDRWEDPDNFYDASQNLTETIGYLECAKKHQLINEDDYIQIFKELIFIAIKKEEN